jgi:hypothetical protein
MCHHCHVLNSDSLIFKKKKVGFSECVSPLFGFLRTNTIDSCSAFLVENWDLLTETVSHSAVHVIDDSGFNAKWQWFDLCIMRMQIIFLILSFMNAIFFLFLMFYFFTNVSIWHKHRKASSLSTHALLISHYRPFIIKKLFFIIRDNFIKINFFNEKRATIEMKDLSLAFSESINVHQLYFLLKCIYLRVSLFSTHLSFVKSCSSVRES